MANAHSVDFGNLDRDIMDFSGDSAEWLAAPGQEHLADSETRPDRPIKITVTDRLHWHNDLLCNYVQSLRISFPRVCAMAKPAVILIGADKGGVGKTTVARTLLDYFGARQLATRAFDTEWPRGTLKRFHPDVTELVDVTSVPDQMKIFDTVSSAEAKVTVIDVRAGLLSSTLQALSDIGFIELGKTGQITFAVFHILGPSIASLEEIAETGRFVGDASHFLVKNHINATSFFEWDPATYKSFFKNIKDAREIAIPQLNEMACEQVEVAGVPYASFVSNKNAKGEVANYSFVLRGYVRHWLGQVWSEYDRVKLPDLVSPKLDKTVRQVAG